MQPAHTTQAANAKSAVGSKRKAEDDVDIEEEGSSKRMRGEGQCEANGADYSISRSRLAVEESWPIQKENEKENEKEKEAEAADSTVVHKVSIFDDRLLACGVCCVGCVRAALSCLSSFVCS